METGFWDFWPFLLAVIQFGGMAGAAIHVMLTKTDERAAAGWVGFVVLVPFAGWIIYLLFGVNRIQRRARELRGQQHDMLLISPLPARSELRATEGVVKLRELEGLARFGQKILPESFEPGNAVGVLLNGDEAYPAMIAAIDRAERSIAISTYIFNNDPVGRLFVDALSRAMDRGVRVRLLIDGVGSWYSRPSLIPLLEERGIDYARFLHSFMPWRMPYLNMRNHQKIFVVDGRHAFTGGMNIAEGNVIAEDPRKPIHDCHFRVEGPVVAQLMHTFAYEWNFTTGELLEGPDWFPEIEQAGDVVARGLPAGPDMGLNPIRWTLLGALAEARHNVRIVTPYFIPDATLRTNISLAAMRGVIVDIVLPATNNLPFCDWAAMPQLEGLARAGCRIWKTNGPFDHSKMMTVDGMWAMVGSANWDDRSLRLNFEFNLECYGTTFAGELDSLIERKISTAHPLTHQEIAARPLPVRLRDAAFRLASPYL
ncbi:phospholipase D-like domain-containing protein [Parvibaculum sp.]|uniref:phospholipase D-like domain-containing protein n=1 Tax=Parvibaculum sp. TaxID=2024848 RepID=UPI00271EA03E|nr:phospholipase D-like domain-containing protein [Parvibaculum sp.]MDO9127173.1 phospholipase D-like domain-containing protein [Parvibaculum sp.]MDP1628639.1 phospholipase D-like domain-containing protein [Parvibaculum sp.]MDP2150135.1 phospholipase D-like domain-containing protein [Parvibaculum sp.]MDP3327061.1 phospholipase D-like domain-containing protein [Parvibaculum sp.]